MECNIVSLWDDKEECKIELGKETVKGIWRVKAKVYNRTSLSNTRLR